MYEIKKIKPISLAKYYSVITAIIVLIFGLVNFFLNLAGVGYKFDIPWEQQLTNLFASVIFFYISFWIIGYFFALVYNSIAKKSKGIVVEFKMTDKNQK